ncbi:MAG: carboxypeptidase regulatory-like domain-containing protein [Nitrospiria bacterium]
MKNTSSENRKLFLMINSIILIWGLGCLASAGAYEAISVEHGGELVGKILFKGNRPPKTLHQVKSNADYCGSEIEDDPYKVHLENRGLANVVISLEGISKGKIHVPSIIPLEMVKCRYSPRIFTGVVGDSFGLLNQDPILHNSHLRIEDATLLNIALYPNGKKIVKPLTQSGTIQVKCEIHPFMSATMVIFDHPYFAVTNQNGDYTISDIPAGNYKVKIWHEGVPVIEKEVTIHPAMKTNLSVELSLP